VKNQNISRAHLPPPSPHLCPFDLRPGQTAAAACWTSSGSFADSSESRMFTLTRGSLDYTTPWLQHGESAFLFWKKIRFRWTKNESLLYRASFWQIAEYRLLIDLIHDCLPFERTSSFNRNVCSFFLLAK
jgi:hypothetical protein